MVYTDAAFEMFRASYEQAASSPAVHREITWEELDQARADGRLEVLYEAPDGARAYGVRLDPPRDHALPELRLHCFLDRNLRAYTWAKAKMQSARERTIDPHLSNIMIYQASPEPAMARVWERFEALLLQMASDAIDQDLPIVFVNLANADQLYPWLLDNMAARFGSEKENLDAQHPVERIRSLCERHDLSCLQLLPAFEAAGVETGVLLFEEFVPDNPNEKRWGHYNAAGDALAAETIGAYIREAGLISGAER